MKFKSLFKGTLVAVLVAGLSKCVLAGDLKKLQEEGDILKIVQTSTGFRGEENRVLLVYERQ